MTKPHEMGNGPAPDELTRPNAQTTTTTSLICADDSPSGQQQLAVARLLAQVPDGDLQLAELVRDALAWRAYWAPEAVEMRAEQFEAEISGRLREASKAISSGQNWAKVANSPSYAELQRRRAEPGPLRYTADPVALAEWVRTGATPTARGAAA